MLRALFRGSIVFTGIAVAAAAADPELTNLLPPEAPVVFGANLAEARNTPFGKYVIGRVAEHEKDLAELAAATGFDPRRDLLEIAGASGSGGRGGFVAVRGAFDIDRIVAAAQAHGNSVIGYRGVKLIGAADDSGTLAFLDPTLAVAGSAPEVTAGIDRWRERAQAAPLVAARYAEAASRHDIWVISRGSPTLFADHAPNPTLSGAMKGEIVQAIREMSGGIKFGPEVVISGDSVTGTADEAVALAGVMRFFMSLAGFSAGPRVGQMAEALGARMQVSTEENRVRFSLSIPEPEFERMFERIRRSAAANAPPETPVAANPSSRH
ncbi:MAG: hypothetical protein KIT09_19665 [Bryobacteraceae bacterium]|nr:hypothetical protein [Bryobacteraceae bacterium]